MKDCKLFKIIESANEYVSSLQVSDYEYVFAKSCTMPTIYASVYACMILGWTGFNSNINKHGWADYLNSYQKSDGYYIDPNCYNESYFVKDGWGARHLIPHMLIALERLSSKPKYEFSFLDDVNTADKMINFLNKLDFHNIWGTSNIIMNYGVTLQYSRDYMGLPFNDSIVAMEEWLLKKLRSDCCMWQEGNIDNKTVVYESIRGAYHLFPLLLYDNIEVPNFERIIKYIVSAQNCQGGFDSKKFSSACDDIDAIDPLVRSAYTCGKLDNLLVKYSIFRAQKNVLSNRNKDGGFVFDRRKRFAYGGEKSLSSNKLESNLFGTWFRLLSLLIIADAYGKAPIKLLDFPGYELKVRKSAEH